MSGPIQHGGGLSRAIALFGGDPGDWLDLSTGINPCPPPLPPLPAAAWHRLPDADLLHRAQRAAARFYGTGSHLPLAVPGTQAVIQHVPDLALSGRPIAVVGPTYGEYQRVLAQAGHAVDLVSSIDEIRADHGLAVVVNPNNPTGRRVSRETLLSVADAMADTGGRLLVDEAFGESEPTLSVASDAFAHPGLIVFRSFGKFFGYAGVRLGFVMAPSQTLQRLDASLGPWSVSGPALVLAERFLSGDCAAVQARIRARSEGLDRALASTGLQKIGGTDLFSLIEHPEATALHERLCAQHILTRAFDNAPRWLRIGLTPDAACDQRLTEALRKALA